MLNDELYKRDFSQPHLRCIVEEEEAKYILEEVHEGICGDHMGAKSLVRKIMRIGYFWPMMQQDAQSSSGSVTDAKDMATSNESQGKE